MLFTFLTLVSVLGLILGLFYVQYRGLKMESAPGYLPWLFNLMSRLLKTNPLQTLVSFCQRVFIRPYPPRLRWIYVGLGGSFVYLVLSGFFFALIYPCSMFGILLVFHLVLGGLFAVSLTLSLLFRARVYRLDAVEDIPNVKEWILRLLFWAFIFFGFILVVTALLMMMPWFSLLWHVKTVTLHRYCALFALLSAIAFLYFAHIQKDM